MTTNRLFQCVANLKRRSAWDRGVQKYALEILEELERDRHFKEATFTEADALNGARDWRQYSEGGCSLCYDCEIAERLCTPSELKRKRGGELEPNREETWIDVQSRALFQAWNLIRIKKKHLEFIEKTFETPLSEVMKGK